MKLIRPVLLFSLMMITISFGLTSAHAAEYMSRNQVTITRSVHDDLYIAAGEITIEGDIEGDLVVVGGTIIVNGDVSNDLFVGGGNVTINGTVGHTARIGGGQVIINSRVGRDLLVSGGAVTLGNKTHIRGDVIAGSGTFRSSGTIAKDLIGGFGNLTLEGPIGGDVKAGVDQLTIGRGGRIKGDLKYTSANSAKLSSKAQVSGKIVHRKPPKPKKRAVPVLAKALGWLWHLASMLVIGLVIALLFPKSLKGVEKALSNQLWPSLGIGFGGLFLVPIAIMFVFFTVIGIPLALITLALYLIAIYLSQIYAAASIGSIILRRLAGRELWLGLGVIIGIFALALLQLIPILGGLITFAVILFGLGAMLLSIWTKRQDAQTNS